MQTEVYEDFSQVIGYMMTSGLLGNQLMTIWVYNPTSGMKADLGYLFQCKIIQFLGDWGRDFRL